MKKFFQFSLELISQTWLYTSILLFVLLAVMLTTEVRVPFLHNYQLLAIQTASMEPTMPVGSLAVVKHLSEIENEPQINQIWSFRHPDTNELVTHRIIAVEKFDSNKIIITQGDANQSPDSWQLETSDLVGPVLFSVPYIGYILVTLKSPLGFALLLGIPAILIILEELRYIQTYLAEQLKILHKTYVAS